MTKEEITEGISNASLTVMRDIKIENYGDKIIHLANERFPCGTKDHFLGKKVSFRAKRLLHLQKERKKYSQEMINLPQQIQEFKIFFTISVFGKEKKALFIGELVRFF
ncbi:hypothetical protein, partial [Staphylococcus hyicus]